MKGLVSCCYDLILSELRVRRSGNLYHLLKMAESIDLRCRYAIIEERYNDGSHYTKDEHGRFTGSTGSGGGSSGSGGRNKPDKQNERPVDSNGIPYSRPTLWLPQNEYAHVMEEINTRYDTNFKGKRIGFIKLTTDEGFFDYRFEIHDYNDIISLIKKRGRHR